MLGVRSATGGSGWSRNSGTAFHSPATTLSPPLRGQCSRPAPSIPRPGRFANPFDRKLSARFGFEAETGRIRHFQPVARAHLRRSREVIRSPLPFGLFEPSGSKRSTGFLAGSPPGPASDLFFAPRCALLSIGAPDRYSKLRFALPGYRSLNPGTESMMNRKQLPGQMEKRVGWTAFLSFFGQSFQQ